MEFEIHDENDVPPSGQGAYIDLTLLSGDKAGLTISGGNESGDAKTPTSPTDNTRVRRATRRNTPSQYC
jgi:hypothetical protein